MRKLSFLVRKDVISTKEKLKDDDDDPITILNQKLKEFS